jgi:hypothetical protein
MTVEILMFVVGVWIYAVSTSARDRIGSIGWWALVSVLLGFYTMDSLAGSPPPSVLVIWVSALVATAVILLWAGWVDRHRSASMG